MDNSISTITLMVIIGIFTITFIISALITYKIRRKKSDSKRKENEK